MMTSMHSARWTAVALGAFLVAMTLVAVALIPSAPTGKRQPLTWVTDPNPQRDPQVEAFNRLNPGCRLSIDPDNNGITKVIVQCSAGMGPDLIDFVNEANIQTYVDAGILLDVTDLAPTAGFGLATLPETVRPLVTVKVLTGDHTVAERQFCYPCNVSCYYIFYNKNIFDRYGVPYPSGDMTWDEYVGLARRLTVYPSGSRSLPEIFGGAGVPVNVPILEKGGRFFNADGTVCTIDSPAFAEALEFYRDLRYKHDIEPSPLQKAGVTSQGGYGNGYINWFGEGKVAMFWGARHSLINLRRFAEEQKQIRAAWLRAHPDAGPGEGPQLLRYGCVLVPRFKDGPRYTQFSARCTGINAKGHHLPMAERFMAFLAGPDYSRIINAGADGIPGNRAFIRMEWFVNPDYPGEEEAHRVALQSIRYGKVPDRSPFVNNSVVNRIFGQVISRILAEPDTSRARLEAMLREAADKINLEIARNIARNRKLSRLYQVMREQGAAPIRYELQVTGSPVAVNP